MKLTRTHLFIILLLVLILCSFLGGRCGSREGMENKNVKSSTDYYKNLDGSTIDKRDKEPKIDKLGEGEVAKEQSWAHDEVYDKDIPIKDVKNKLQPSNYDDNNDYQKKMGFRNRMPSEGIKKEDIPPGQEDLYILKSEVVPPVCPACPVNSSCPRPKPCPPCPPCARCPEPSFECKKVPNYAAINNDYVPRPVMADFSQFGL